MAYSTMTYCIEQAMLQRALDININAPPQVLYLCLALHNYFELQKEKIPEQSLEKQSFEKRV